MNFKELRRTSGMTQQKFADYFGIPKRTIENWEAGVNKCPEYLLNLMKYKLENEKIEPIIKIEPILSKKLFDKMQYQRKFIAKTSTDDNIQTPTYHTRCNECGSEVMCLDSVKEHLTDCPRCGAKLDK